MRKLIWGLAFVAVVIGFAVAVQKRNAQPGGSSQGEGRVRRALSARPHLPGTDLGNTLGEAIEEAADEIAPSASAT